MSRIYVHLSRVASLPPDACEAHKRAAAAYDAHIAEAASTLDEVHDVLRQQLVSGSPDQIEQVVQALTAASAAWGSTSLASWLLEWLRDYTHVEATLAAVEQQDYRQRMSEEA